MATTTAESAKGFEYFLEIVNAFKEAAASADGADVGATKVEPFLNAMTMFLRIFDAFGNPFFVDVVKKDVQGNIKVRSERRACASIVFADASDVETACGIG